MAQVRSNKPQAPAQPPGPAGEGVGSGISEANPFAETPVQEQLRALRDRVAWIEQYFGIPARDVAEADQAAKDADTLSRTPNSYEEAVEYEAARERQDARESKADGEEKQD